MSNPKRFPATPDTPSSVSRRTFLGTAGALGALAGLERITPAYARPLHQTSSRWLESGAGADASDADAMNLVIREASIDIAGKRATATAINDTVPGPLLRFREGRDYTVRVANHLNGDTSIHWHGVLVPNAMDGVPGVTFAGIRPGETFAYQLPLRQSGTYWYHSHSGLQEQTGLYGPIIIDPAEPEPFAYDREYVVMLSDWTFEDPYKLLDHLKKQSEYYNYQRRTVPDFFRDVKRRGFRATLNDRMAWGKMRMTPTDISDITGATYTYLMNGLAPESNWTGLFAPGERVRLRFINAGAGTYFDVRVPGLEMTVVAVSGQYVKPVVTDEFRLEIAQTVDVIVQPSESHAYTIFAESMDRSGYARGTLSPRLGMAAAVPMRRPRPTLLMGDMGMAMQDMAGMDMGGGMPDMPGMPAAAPTAAPSPLASNGLRAPGTLPPAVEHGPETHGSGNAATPQITRSRLGEPGNGLGADGWRVLRYTDLRALLPHADALRPPEREVEFHLTGNMERYMWSIDGVKFSDVKEPVHFTQGERIRITMVNDTMMSHPMHLHGMWMDLENGSGADMPRVHTINVKPAERLSVLVSPADVGGWAFHCHILYHMEMGMFRVVQVAPANRLTTGGGPGDEGVR
jgi:CopA family copper-resistance protein